MQLKWTNHIDLALQPMALGRIRFHQAEPARADAPQFGQVAAIAGAQVEQQIACGKIGR